jgi:hypothetical protein
LLLLLRPAEAYDILHVLGGLSNDEIAAVFAEWNQGELQVSLQAFGFGIRKSIELNSLRPSACITCREAPCKCFMQVLTVPTRPIIREWLSTQLVTGYAAVIDTMPLLLLLLLLLLPPPPPHTHTQSFLIEISAIIANKKDEEAGGYLVDKIVDKTGAKGTGDCIGV